MTSAFTTGPSPIAGATLGSAAVVRDSRGALLPFETETLPFAPRRFFVIVADPPAVRAEHASSSEEILVILAGGVTCDLDNGSDRVSVRLEGVGSALWLRPGVWIRLADFVQGTVIGVAASQSYAETQQWPYPQPDLFAQGSRSR